MTRQEIEREYFEWMYNMICGGRYSKENSYRRLLTNLHEIEFTYIIPKDSNRAEDGKDLRYRFAYFHKYPAAVETMLTGPCSVLEMMIALSIRCEDIMDDPSLGNRTGQWFWKMIVNLGLGGMYDARYDKDLVDESIYIFLNREYESDGRGGLFRIKNCENDMRKFEIWIQMLWYLDTIM